MQGDLGGWYVELSFVARVVTYVAILGIVLKSHFVRFFICLYLCG